jgi:predicted enzyme related to lactoylglutathione lyase
LVGKRCTVSHECRLLVDDTNLDALRHEPPKSVGHVELVFDDEMAEIMGKSIAVAREVPARARPIVPTDIYPIAAAWPPHERDLEHTSSMTPPATRSRLPVAEFAIFGDYRAMSERPPHWSMVINCADIERLTEFWCAVLRLEPHSADVSFRVLRGAHGNVALQVSDDPVTDRHQMHVDIYCAAADRDAECSRVLALGASHVRDSDDPDDAYVVFTDPEGNEFCICPI